MVSSPRFDHQSRAPDHYRDPRILGRPQLEKKMHWTRIKTTVISKPFCSVMIAICRRWLLEPLHDSVIVVGTKIKRKSVNDEKECQKTCILHSRTLYNPSLRGLPASLIDVNVQSALSFDGGSVVVIGNRLDRNGSDGIVVVTVQLRIRDRGRREVVWRRGGRGALAAVSPSSSWCESGSLRDRQGRVFDVLAVAF
jgi:hypothetical protein